MKEANEIKKFKFDNLEANMVFSLSIFITKLVKDIDKKYEKKEIGVERYINLRQELQNKIINFEKELKGVKIDKCTE